MKRKCPKCGAEESSDTLQGLCPACVIQVTLSSLASENPSATGLSRRGHTSGNALDVAADASPAGKAAAGDRRPSSPRLVGDYELLEELAHGGMGVVWRARQISLNRIVAVKMIRAGLLAGDAEVKRFHAEAEAAASLDHPNIVPLYEVGEQCGQHFFSLKLIEGGSLAGRSTGGRWFREHCPVHRAPSLLALGRLRCCPTAAALIAKVARAIHYAHQRGLIHRDLKPGNILLDAQGEPHVTDFGLAKQVESSVDLTLTGAVLGTPSYMSPEQASGQAKRITTATDIYSLGAILYELLTGRPPFQADTPLETLRQVVEDEPVPPSKVERSNRLRVERSSELSGERPGGERGASLNSQLQPLSTLPVDRDLETICLKCLEKDPQQRYGSAEALAEDLERWLHHEPILARRSTAIERVVKWIQRHPVRAATVVAFGSVVLLGAGGVLWQWREATKNRAVAEAALRQSQASLWQANFDRAHALRTSRQMGQRLEALKALRAAAAIRPTPELREEAIAALALTDLEDVGTWMSPPPHTPSWTVDTRFELIALSRPDGVIEIRDFQDGRLQAVMTNGPPPANPHFSEAGDLLVAADRARYRIWDWRNTNLLAQCLPGTDDSWPVLSPDGRRVAYLASTSSVAWLDVHANHERGRLEGLPGQARALALTTDGTWLAMEVHREIAVWRLADRALLGRRSLPASIFGSAWFRDEPLLAIGCEDRHLYVWDVATDRLQQLPGHLREGVWPYWHSSGNLLASIAWDHVLRLWDPYAGVQLLETKFGRPTGFSPDGQWLGVSNARGAGRLKVHLPEECRLFHAPLGLKQNFPVAFSPDDRFIAGMVEDVVWIWEVASGRRVAHQPVEGQVCVEFTSPRTLVTSGTVGVLLWTNTHPADGWTLSRPAVVVPPGDGHLSWAALNANRTQLAVRRDAIGEVYDIPSGRLRFTLKGQRLFNGATFSSDGRWLASGYLDSAGEHRSEFWIWSAEDGQPVCKLPNGNGGGAFSPDGRWLLVASEKEYFQFAVNAHPTNWLLVRQYPRDVSGFDEGAMAFSSDSKLLAVQGDQRIFRLLEAATGRELARLTPLLDAYRTGNAAFSHNGRWFVAASDLGLHVWDLHLIRHRLRDLGLDWEVER